MKFKLRFPNGIINYSRFSSEEHREDREELKAINESIINKIENKTLELNFLPTPGMSFNLEKFGPIFAFTKEELETLTGECADLPDITYVLIEPTLIILVFDIFKT